MSLPGNHPGETKVLPSNEIASAVVGDGDSFFAHFKLRPARTGGPEEVFSRFLDDHNCAEQSGAACEVVEGEGSGIPVGGRRIGRSRPKHSQRNGHHQGSLQGDLRQKEGLVVACSAERVKREDHPHEAGGRVSCEAVATQEKAGGQQLQRRFLEVDRLLAGGAPAPAQQPAQSGNIKPETHAVFAMRALQWPGNDDGPPSVRR